MTRKHFIALARALRESGATLAVCSAVADVCHEMGGFDTNGNRRFRRDVFLTYCGVS